MNFVAILAEYSGMKWISNNWTYWNCREIWNIALEIGKKSVGGEEKETEGGWS